MNHGYGARLLYRVALACSGRDRRWIQAFFAELEVIDGRARRFHWLVGLGGLLASGWVGRLRSLLLDPALAGAGLSLISALSLGFISLRGYELRGADDDVTGIAALLAVAVFLALLRRAWQQGLIRGNASRGDPKRHVAEEI